VAAVLAVLGGCGGGDLLDPYPVQVDLTAGAALVTVSSGLEGERIPAVLDTMAPITILDGFVPGEPIPSARRRKVDLTLYAGSGDAAIPRAEFLGVSAFELHPCSDESGYCQFGLDANLTQFRAIVGADVMARGAVRFDVPASAVTFFPDIAGDDDARGRACDAVFPSPFAGGGTLTLAGSEVVFSGTRVALGACLHFDVTQPNELDRGADALFVLSTGIGISVLSESAYERYRVRVGDAGLAPALGDLSTGRLHLPSGELTARLGTVTRVALVGQGSDQRGPCQEVYANHVLSVNGCRDTASPVSPCPCSDDRTFCSTAATIELADSFPVAVISDLAPLLQALRDELRPSYPEVDGILGLGALGATSLDIDYHNQRMLARCADGTNCATRPEVRSLNKLSEIAACLGSTDTGVTGPPPAR
jgi:hypothetical protein